LLLALGLLAVARGAAAATLDLPPAADTTLYQGSEPGDDFEDNSCGAGSGLFAGVTVDGFARRALLRFDAASQIPAGSSITGVTLTLVVNRSQDGQDAPMSLHLPGLDWGEGSVNCDGNRGGGKGDPAQVGDATWQEAQFGLQAWAAPGGDFGNARASSLVGPDNGNQAVWDSAASPDLVNDVQSWLDQPGSNRGWLLLGDESRSTTARRFASREGSPQPVLRVDFDPPGDAFSCCFAEGDCAILAQDTCTGQGGTPDLESTTCSPNPCLQPVGACCNADQSCSDDLARDVCESAGGLFQSAGSICADPGVNCGLEPFVDALPLPGVLAQTGTRPDGTPQYRITMTEQQQKLHRDLPATTVWTYEGTYPGPTIEATVGEPIEITYVNELPPGEHHLAVDTCPHGPNYWSDSPRSVVHLHGGHVPARFDGQPEYDFLPGAMDTYEYPNDQLPATLWYHDHALGITRLNVYMGLAGYYLLRDDFEAGLGLPAGPYEIPAVIQDRRFNEDGSLLYPTGVQNGFFGDVALVNGKVWPFLNVAQGKYRLRLVNGSQARSYALRLENLADPAQLIPFELIGTDGGLVGAPITLNTLAPIAPAERLDVVVDFSGFAPGTGVVLRNDDATAPLLPNIMKFVVTDQAGFTDPLPASLRVVAPIPEAEAAGTRRFLLERVNEACAGVEWLVKSLDGQGNVIGEHWDDITEYPTLGSTEIWQFENPGNVTHPMHVHLVMFQVLDKHDLTSGAPIPLKAWEQQSWKDTVEVPPGSRVRVIMRFDDYLGKFPYHCHILDHEDHEMMRQFQVTNDPARCVADGLCEVNEDCVSCAADCPELSGAACGNGLCEAGDGENCVSCPADCAGNQGAGPKFCCGFDDGVVRGPIGCGESADDSRCIEASADRFCRVAARVSACCGDALCEGQETLASCAVDCLDTDGDGFTNATDRDDDADGLPDEDEAALGTNPLLPDTDADSIADGVDLCPRFASGDQSDTDGNGRGDVCECGDQNGDGTVDVRDILAINAAIFAPAQATPLCDANDDGACDVQDILAVNATIFGAAAYCERFPRP
jgi:spore coat protein A